MSEISQVLNSLGLICNIVGVVLVWIFGWPQPSHEEGVSLGLENSTPLPNGLTVAQNNVLIRDRRAKYKFQSSAGVTLMALGFIFQLIATWM